MEKMIDDLTNLLLNMSAGLHPDHLTEDEVEMLKSEYGDNWLNALGYTEDWLKNNPSASYEKLLFYNGFKD